uniref:Uncharacterized protein n=1 Tax=Lygus hesperus TaxID=30085 RepID=A0A0K8SHG2_LYGHE
MRSSEPPFEKRSNEVSVTPSNHRQQLLHEGLGNPPRDRCLPLTALPHSSPFKRFVELTPVIREEGGKQTTSTRSPSALLADRRHRTKKEDITKVASSVQPPCKKRTNDKRTRSEKRVFQHPCIGKTAIDPHS